MSGVTGIGGAPTLGQSSGVGGANLLGVTVFGATPKAPEKVEVARYDATVGMPSIKGKGEAFREERVVVTQTIVKALGNALGKFEKIEE
jgi:hypothetical protein